jgi:hypothetical protein
MCDAFFLLRDAFYAQEIRAKLLNYYELLNEANECNKWQTNYLKINSLTIKAIGSWGKAYGGENYKLK